MSQNQPRLSHIQRKDLIKNNIAHHTQEEIGVMCGVRRETISRDIRIMKETGEWFEWIESEFLYLHREGKVKDSEKYFAFARLYAKELPTALKMQIKKEIKVEEKHVSIVGTLADYERVLEAALNRNLQRNNPRKPLDTAQTHAETS